MVEQIYLCDFKGCSRLTYKMIKDGGFFGGSTVADLCREHYTELLEYINSKTRDLSIRDSL